MHWKDIKMSDNHLDSNIPKYMNIDTYYIMYVI